MLVTVYFLRGLVGMAGGRQDRVFADKLKYAVGKGDVTMARRLIKGGVDINGTYWYDGTLLHEAVAAGNVPMVKLLLQAHANVNARNKDGRTGLHLASRLGHLEMVQELVKSGASMNSQTDDGRTGLHIATWRGHVDVINELVKAGACVNKLDEDGWTPLHWAAKSNLPTVAELLIQNQAKINVTDKLGKTPLHESIVNNHLNLMSSLLKAGADSNIKPKTGSTLFLLTQQQTCSPLHIKILVNTGYDLTRDQWYHSGKMPESLSKENDLISWLHSHENVSKLSHLCRMRIRKHLNNCHGGRAVTKWLDLLPLPQILRDYVALTDELKPP